MLKLTRIYNHISSYLDSLDLHYYVARWYDPVTAHATKWIDFGYMYYSTDAEDVGPTLPKVKQGDSLNEWYETLP